MTVRTILMTLLLAVLPRPILSKEIVIKMATIAPDGSPWHQSLLKMGDRWRTITGGQVKLNLYAGTLGDEPNLVDKLRIGQIQAAALSGALTDVEPAVGCFQIPMMFDSYEELDYVRDRITPRLEKMIEQKGYLVLHWGDVGWVEFFTTTPVVRLDDMRKLKLFTWAGDAKVLQLWKANGFRAVPLAATDILPGLQTGLIEAVPSAPLFALLNQSFGFAKNMTDIHWVPLIGASIVSKNTWNQIPESQRDPMRQAARECGEALRGGIRKMNEEAVAAMQKRGLRVVHVDDAALADWRRQVEAVYPKIRGGLAPAELFDEVRRLRDEFRAGSQIAGGKP
jgi:TRAP-type transport system periplasmic protein